MYIQKVFLSHITLRLIPERDHKGGKCLPYNTAVFPIFETKTID